MERIFSGAQPTGNLHLGNYLGAIRNWVKLQDTYECVYCVVDMHAITIFKEPEELVHNVHEVAACMLAAGVDPKRHILFNQSRVPAHAQLAWVLNCTARMGWMSRMTQFKDKAGKNRENASLGLFAYPSLMAADILVYKATHVPVGEDQKQHLELTRNIAQRFNQAYGDTFVVPDGYIPAANEGAKIMSLQEPTKKMSKSDENPNAFITILDDKDTIVRKFKRAVTDSDMEIRYAEGKDGINNLMSIYSAITKKSYEEIQREFEGKGYGDFKTAVGETVAEELRPIREEYDRLMADKAYLESCYRDGAQKARTISQRTLDKVYKKIGFLPASL